MKKNKSGGKCKSLGKLVVDWEGGCRGEVGVKVRKEA